MRPLPKIYSLFSFTKNERRKCNLLSRDGYKCYICQTSLTVFTVTLDHIIPRCEGGGSNADNLACCCIKCNNMKSKAEGFIFGNEGNKMEKNILIAYSYFNQIVYNRKRYEN